MKIDDVRRNAWAMPLTNPSFPRGPYRFFDREYLIVTYRTDPEALRAVVPEPLEINEPVVKYEFIRMPYSTGFGDYTETGQVIPVSLNGRKGGYTHAMFLNDEPPIAGGRELWGFPKKLANPSLKVEVDTLVGTLDYGPVRVATGTMGYKHRNLDLKEVATSLATPNFLLKIIPDTAINATPMSIASLGLITVSPRVMDWLSPVPSSTAAGSPDLCCSHRDARAVRCRAAA